MLTLLCTGLKSNAAETDKPAASERGSGTSTSSIMFDFDQADEPATSSLDFSITETSDMDHRLGQMGDGPLDVDHETDFLLASLGAHDMEQQDNTMADHQHPYLTHQDMHHDLGPMGFHQQTAPVPFPPASSNQASSSSIPFPTPVSEAELDFGKRRPVERDTHGARDLESRIQHIIRAVQEAGFESIDDMATQYYTAQFEEDTASYWAQSLSRSHSLYNFLSSLHRSTSGWSDRDIQRYRQQILTAAESLYASEIDSAKHMKDEGVRPPTPVSSVEALWRMMGDMELDQESKVKKMAIRERMPETWSLLARLTQKADLHQPQGSQAVFAFLLLLIQSGRNPAARA